MKRLLALSAHPDDIEISCGGTIARFLEAGWYVHHAVFCASELHEDEAMDKDTRWAEFDRANEVLGVQETSKFDLPHRKLLQARQDVLDLMCELRRQMAPHLVIMPSTDDLHQDHRAVAMEGLRAFKKVNLWGFEVLWNNLTFNANHFVTLKKHHVEKKLTALREYRTQHIKDYFHPAFIVSMAKVRGVQVGHEFAECFQAIRGII